MSERSLLGLVAECHFRDHYTFGQKEAVQWGCIAKVSEMYVDVTPSRVSFGNRSLVERL